MSVAVTPWEPRFWAKVQKSDGCWVWQAAKAHRGYGSFRRDRRSQRAHRLVWELTYGPIPDGLCVLHRCDNPPCVRPDHLFLGTKADNMADKIRKGRQGRGYRLRPGLVRPGAQGSRHYLTHLTEEDVLSIRAGFANGEPRRIIAERYGLGLGGVSAILNRSTWKHVP